MKTVKKFLTISILQPVALTALYCAAGGSFAFMLNTGRYNDSYFLMLAFTVWVLSPFVALLVANAYSKRWPLLTRQTLYWLMILITVVSLLFYSGTVSVPGAKPAFVFLIIPLVSWILLGLLILAAGWQSRRLNEANK